MLARLLLLICFLVPCSTGIQPLRFARMISPLDLALPYVFNPMLSRTVGSRIECSAWAISTSTLPVKSQRASGFIYNKTTSACQLGRTPTYNDYFMSNGIVDDVYDAEVYILIGKPLASILNSDTWFYALLNEEKSAFFSHPNFVMAWPNPPGWGYFSYSYISPVQSYAGMYGMTFNGSAGLMFTASPSSPPSGLSFSMWYHALPTYNDCPAVCLCSASSYLAEMWLQFSTGKVWMAYTSQQNSYSSAGATPVGNWIYYSWTYDAATSNHTFYINGTAFGTSIGLMSNFGSLINYVTIGRNCAGGSATPTGVIASVEIYLRPLSATEVAQKMAKSYTGRTLSGTLTP